MSISYEHQQMINDIADHCINMIPENDDYVMNSIIELCQTIKPGILLIHLRFKVRAIGKGRYDMTVEELMNNAEIYNKDLPEKSSLKRKYCTPQRLPPTPSAPVKPRFRNFMDVTEEQPVAKRTLHF